jgi:hypothetical protein
MEFRAIFANVPSLLRVHREILAEVVAITDMVRPIVVRRRRRRRRRGEMSHLIDRLRCEQGRMASALVTVLAARIPVRLSALLHVTSSHSKFVVFNLLLERRCWP